jgi:F-type H+-transporting ATPase subunit epsilon|tara:strand:+ start:347 stop:736 length:390 start_codon:yes stop_codon:yes gene_type:complete
MSESFNLEIISPEKTFLQAETNQVIIPAFEGLMTILKNHISLVTFLRPGFIKVNKNEGTEAFFVEEGTVEFSNDKLLILSSSIINKKDFSTVQVSNMLKDTKKEINNNNLSDKIKYILSYKIEALESIN